MIKKGIFTLCILWGLLFCSINCNAVGMEQNKMDEYSAESRGSLLETGYTDDGIYYEVYGKRISSRAVDGILVTRTVVFQGDVIPEGSMYWKEYVGGEAYSGTLYLLRFAYNSGETTAVYQGTLYKRIE